MQARGAASILETSAASGQRDPFSELIERAVEAGVRKALGEQQQDPFGPYRTRLVSVEQAGEYLNLSKREIYNIIANAELAAVRHGRRTMLDVRDLDEWIRRNKH